MFLTEIYPSREQPAAGRDGRPHRRRARRRTGRKLLWRGERGALADALASAVLEGDVVITMGAGDITRTGPELLARLRRAA